MPAFNGTNQCEMPLHVANQQDFSLVQCEERVKVFITVEVANQEPAIDEPALVRGSFELRVVHPDEPAAADELLEERLSAAIALQGESFTLMCRQVDEPAVVNVEPRETDDLVVGRSKPDLAADTGEATVSTVSIDLREL